MSFVRSLACRACGAAHPVAAVTACERCGGPLDPIYDWEALGESIRRDDLSTRPHTIWRYRELLPLEDAPAVSRNVGWTPLVDTPGLADLLGVKRVWIKFDGASFPSLSFKDRPVAVAINKAKELGLETVGCPSTGNLANAVASHAAAAGLDAWIFVPETIEPQKILATAVYRPNVVRVRGTYDEINRLCRAAAERFGWGIVNVNLRAYYAEGSKTMAFEIAEQLGWKPPTAVVAPMAGGALVTKLARGFNELAQLGWLEGELPRINGVQPSGCAPIVTAVQDGVDTVTPVTPETRVHSLAIGDPVDGAWAVRAIHGSGGWAAAVTDEDMVEGIRLLAESAGIFTETAGGVTVAGARALMHDARLRPDDEVVLCLTGNGLKTPDAIADTLDEAPVIGPTVDALETLLG